MFKGKVKIVVVWKLDRLSRSIVDGLNVLADWCNRGIRVVSVTQQLDFNGTVGKMLAAIFFALGEMEQETRRERQAAGIALAKKRQVPGPEAWHLEGRCRPGCEVAGTRAEG